MGNLSKDIMGTRNQNNIDKTGISITRRGFLGLTGKLAVVIAFGALVQLREGENKFIRPLTAVPEKDFLSRCTRCQKCIEACPY